MENLRQARRRDLGRSLRRGGTSGAKASPMVVSSITEVRGGRTTSLTAVGRATAMENPTSLSRIGRLAHGDMVASPMAATATRVEAHGSNATSPTAGVDMEVVARAGATASPIAGGSEARTSRAHPGALRTAMSGRAAAQQEPPALRAGRLLRRPRARETEPPQTREPTCGRTARISSPPLRPLSASSSSLPPLHRTGVLSEESPAHRRRLGSNRELVQAKRGLWAA